MKIRPRTVFWNILCLLAPTLLAAGISAADPWRNPYYAADGIGGTGISDDRGIGGTGIDGGIGGTGIDDGVGGTGIIGTITGFGSVIVNGARVTYDPALPVESLAGRTTPQDFRLGQVVAVETIDRNGVLHAQRARIRIPVAGQVANIDTRNNRILVLDRWVQMSPDVLINDDSNPNLPPIIGIGDYVQVSGLTRPDGIIVRAGSSAGRRDARVSSASSTGRRPKDSPSGVITSTGLTANRSPKSHPAERSSSRAGSGKGGWCPNACGYAPKYRSTGAIAGCWWRASPAKTEMPFGSP